MRKLAHIEVIESLTPIKDADKIEVATVLGWQCVVKKGEFKVGEKVIYVEVDSIVPDKPEFEFLRDRKFRVRTIRLRGQISQGLISPVPENWKSASEHRHTIGADVTELLGITKYVSPSEQEEFDAQERKISLEKNKIKKFMMRYKWFRKLVIPKKVGQWPYWISKTDEERIQNLPHILKLFADKEVYVTEKLITRV